jgi:hypothetical protein
MQNRRCPRIRCFCLKKKEECWHRLEAVNDKETVLLRAKFAILVPFCIKREPVGDNSSVGTPGVDSIDDIKRSLSWTGYLRENLNEPP